MATICMFLVRALPMLNGSRASLNGQLLTDERPARLWQKRVRAHKHVCLNH